MKAKSRFYLSLFLFVLLLSSCTSTQSLRRGDWVEHGFSAEDRESLYSFVQEAVDNNEIPGMSVLLLHKGEVIFEEGFGYADIENKVPFKANAICRIASISKPLMATVIVRLAQKGLLDIDKPIDFYLPEFKDIKLKNGQKTSRAPTVRELLSHTGGLDDETPWNRKENQQPGVTLEKMVKKYAAEGLVYEPGRYKLYSGMGIDTAARVAEVVTGKYRDELLLEELARPLGLKTLTYCPEKKVVDSMPRVYRKSGDGFKLGSHYIDTMAPKPKSQYSSTGGGIVCSPQDLAVWLLMCRNIGVHQGKPFISKAWMRQMFTRGPPGQIGIGFAVGEGSKAGYPRAVWHSGSTGTYCWIDFEQDIIGITFLQSGRYFRSAVQDKFYEILGASLPKSNPKLGAYPKD